MSQDEITLVCSGGLTPWSAKIVPSDTPVRLPVDPNKSVHVGERIMFLIWPTNSSSFNWFESRAEVKSGPMWKHRTPLVRMASSAATGCGFEFTASQTGELCLVCLLARDATGQTHKKYSIIFCVGEAFKLTSGIISNTFPARGLTVWIKIICISPSGAIVEAIDFENEHEAEIIGLTEKVELKENEQYCLALKISNEVPLGTGIGRLVFNFRLPDEQNLINIPFGNYSRPSTSANKIVSHWLLRSKTEIKPNEQCSSSLIQIKLWPKTACIVLHPYPVRIVVTSKDLRIHEVRFSPDKSGNYCWTGCTSFRPKHYLSEVVADSTLVILKPGIHGIGYAQIDLLNADGAIITSPEQYLGYVIAYP